MNKGEHVFLTSASMCTAFVNFLIPLFLYLTIDFSTPTFAFILRAHVNGNTPCSEHGAESCFMNLFEQMPEICNDHLDLSFRCHHYKFLDDCFQAVGVCPAPIVGAAAKRAYRSQLFHCQKLSGKVHRDASTSTTSLQRPRRPQPAPVAATELQFISLIGYLQTRCAASSIGHHNCTAEMNDQLLNNCEEDIRRKASRGNVDFDRHQILRIKLDASRKILQYGETRREDECLIVRSALTDIFRIHHRYCFQTIVTRCLCDRMNFDRSCNVNCTALEPNGPAEQRLAWADFRGRLIASGSAGLFTIERILLLIVLCMFFRNM